MSTPAHTHLPNLQALLSPSEILTSLSPSYTANAQPWAAQKDQQPPVVIRPETIHSLSTILPILYNSDIDFTIRGHGFSSASARDVILSMTAFDSFEFDREKSVVTVGAGQTWLDVMKKMEVEAEGFAVVAARTPCLSIGGTVMTGGFSWLSSEFGCISDPNNMLDARVVKADGSVIWASTEPDLLWSLRGGGGGFCVATHFILRAFPYPPKVWAGPILLPKSSLTLVTQGLAKFMAGDIHPKVSMFLYFLRKRLLGSISAEGDGLVLHAFDALGEEHGRETFEWALRIPGAVDQTGMMSLVEVSELQARVADMKGTMKQFWTPMLLPTFTESTITKSIDWFEKIGNMGDSLASSTLLIFELLATRDPLPPDTDTAWPRPPGSKHILLIGTGCNADGSTEEEEQARDLAMSAPGEVLGEGCEEHVMPNGAEEWHSRREIYGANYERLIGVKKTYDPKGRFKGLISGV